MLKLNRKYTVCNNTLQVIRFVTRDNAVLIGVKLNKSTVYVRNEDVIRKGLLLALSNKRRYCKTLTANQYELLGGVLWHLSKLQQLSN